MSPEQVETKEIWQTIERSDELLQRYGYYPTLHDALVLDIDLNAENRSVSLTFEYSDLDVNDKSVRTKLRIGWTDVLKLELCLYGNDVSRIAFRRTENGLITEFEQSFGIHGSIESGGIELREVGESERKQGDGNDHTPMLRMT